MPVFVLLPLLYIFLLVFEIQTDAEQILYARARFNTEFSQKKTWKKHDHSYSNSAVEKRTTKLDVLTFCIVSNICHIAIKDFYRCWSNKSPVCKAMHSVSSKGNLPLYLLIEPT